MSPYEASFCRVCKALASHLEYCSESDVRAWLDADGMTPDIDIVGTALCDALKCGESSGMEDCDPVLEAAVAEGWITREDADAVWTGDPRTVAR